MNTHYSPNLTIPGEAVPAIELPLFSDQEQLPPRVAALSRGAQQMANIMLRFGAEATLLQGTAPEDVHASYAAGRLAIGATAYEATWNATEQRMVAIAKPGIYSIAPVDLTDDDGTWHSRLTIDRDVVEISGGSNIPGYYTRASARFRKRDDGTYEPERLCHTEELRRAPYKAEEHGVVFRELTSYKQACTYESPSAVLRRLHACTLLHAAAEHYTDLLRDNPMTTAWHITVEGAHIANI